MRMGLHFFEADTPPFCGSKTPKKSEISQDLGKSRKVRKTEQNNHQLNGRCVSLYILIFSILNQQKNLNDS